MALVVVVTGGSGGIGESLAKLLASKGNKVLIVARREEELKRVQQESGENVQYFVGDVTKREDVENALKKAIETFGKVDVWVNNAGRGINKSVLELQDEDIDDMITVNVKSALYGMQVAARYFISQESKEGQIVNVSSVLGRIPFAGIRSAYSAAKHALNSLSANLRTDLKKTYPNIVVSTVSPGPVATDFGINVKYGGPDSRLNPHTQTPDEVADVIYGAIQSKEIDVYTRPVYQENVINYLNNIGTFETEKFYPAPIVNQQQ